MYDDLERDLARRASQSWDAHRDQWQAIVNARDIPPLRFQTIPADPIPVQVCIVWERDGLEVVDAVANGWTSRLVLVDLDDRRARLRAVWLDPSDVRRRRPTLGA
ncbi:hypothetical protein ACFWGN_20610 [Oerskovia sp. NPDC060338]|uniref:hypothetical protein n=1 Tax=Oerskovia sp. NPDC060338 TaxID=3347100 RepID=UPI003649F7D5